MRTRSELRHDNSLEVASDDFAYWPRDTLGFRRSRVPPRSSRPHAASASVSAVAPLVLVGSLSQRNELPKFTKLFVVQKLSFWHNLYMADENTRTLNTPPRGADYRLLADEIRAVAVRTPLPAARQELAQLAAKYKRRADHLDRR